MNDTEIRLHCVEVADGNLSIAKQIYDWVMARDERGIVVGYPLSGSASDTFQGKPVAGLNVGIPVGSGSATTRA